MAAYCFCKAVPATDAPGACAPGFAHSQIFSTVSHFNLIHISCHSAAKSADAALRTPKREWEGAVLRNGEVLCNNLLPVRGPQVPDTAYIEAMLVHWDSLLSLSGIGIHKHSSLKQGDTTPLRLSMVSSDIAGLLERFAYKRGFSEDSHGGGRESNGRLLPVMLQLGRYYAEQSFSAELQPHKALVDGFSAGSSTAGASAAAGTSTGGISTDSIRISIGGAADASPMPYVLSLCLLLQSPAEWAAGRRTLLSQAICYGVQTALENGFSPGSTPSGSATSTPSMSPFGTPSASMSSPRSPPWATSASTCTPQRSAASAPAPRHPLGPEALQSMGPQELFRLAKPMINFFAMVNWLQHWSKGSAGREEWPAAMKAKLGDLPAIFSGTKELLELLGDLEDSDSCQESFDIMEVLAEVMQGGCTADGFLLQACSSLRGAC